MAAHSRNPRLIATFLVTIFAYGCSATHHFIPHHPLPKKESQLSITWNYDLSGLILPGLLPDVNLYWRFEDQYNVGFGYQFPIQLTHLTVIRYFPFNDDDQWATFFHLNRPFAMTTNPYFELGGAYLNNSHGIRQNFSAGLGYCTGPGIPFFKSYSDPAWTPVRRIFPFAKYSLFGADAGISISHYHGQTKARLKGFLNKVANYNDTLMAFDASRIDSIIPADFLSRSNWSTIHFYLNDGQQISLSRRFICGNEVMADAADPEVILSINQGYTKMQFESGPYRSFYVNLHQLSLDLTEKKHIVFTRYPPEVVGVINDFNNWRVDTSVGVSIINNFINKPKK